MSTNSNRDWIDNSGCLTMGKYAGSLVEDIAIDDPDYLQWLLDNVEYMSDEDRGVISAHLGRRRPNSNRSSTWR